MQNFFSGLWSRLKNFIFPSAAIQRTFQVTPEVSQTMEQNIGLWYSLYVNQPPWKTKEIVPIGLPAAICREMARPVLTELTVNISGSERADFLNETFQAARENFLRQLELSLALGGAAFKPYIYGDRILVDATSAAAFQPTKFDPAGICIGGVFQEKIKKDGRYYVRLEYHELTGTKYTIRNKAFQSDSSGGVGESISLSVVPEWADIPPEVSIENVNGPLFAYFKVPTSNNIETESKVGMSIYGGSTVDLIRRADEQWDLIRWEYKSGQRKILMDGTESMAAQFDRRLFEIGPLSSKGDFFEIFSPEFRDEPLYRGFQSILKQIEFQVGLSYGTISDPQSIEKTATEIRNSKQRMYITIDSIQKALQHVFDGLIYAMDVYASLYHMAPPGVYTTVYDWGDSILEDADAKERERANDRQDLAAGIMNSYEYRMKWYNEDEATAKAALPQMEDLVSGN